MQALIQKIIDAGIRAPSGENSQPWRFEIKNGEIYLFNLPERDNSLYNWGQRGAYIAHGSLLQNMEIMAESEGYGLNFSIFPDSNRPNLVAKISVMPPTKTPGNLAEQIFQRATNRKPYKNYKLNENERRDLLNSENELRTKAKFILVEEKNTIAELGSLAGNNERILFENEHLHHFFFSHINWDAEEDAKKSIGFYLKTLELPPPVQLGFKLFKHWSVERVLNKIGFPKIIAIGNGKLYGTASAFGAIIIDGDSPEQYIEAGRLLQLIWLKLTKHGLSLQPLTGILFLMQGIKAGEADKLSTPHQELIKQIYNKIQNLFGTPGTVVMMFRIGKADPPTAKSSRLKAQI